MHQCRRCLLTFPLAGFAPSKARLKNWVCRGCSSRESMDKYAEKRAYIDAVKLAAGCADCGYNTSPYALEFDHRPGTQKIDKVSNLAGCRSLAVVKAEIAKCDVVCSNCHAIRTAERRQSAVWWEEWREGQHRELPADSGWLRLFEEVS